MTAREILVIAAVNGMYSTRHKTTKVDCSSVYCAECPIHFETCGLQQEDYVNSLKELPTAFFESIATPELAIANYPEFAV